MNLLSHHIQTLPLLFPLAKALLLAFILAWAGKALLAGQSIPDALLTGLYYLELSLNTCLMTFLKTNLESV